MLHYSNIVATVEEQVSRFSSSALWKLRGASGHDDSSARAERDTPRPDMGPSQGRARIYFQDLFYHADRSLECGCFEQVR